MVLASEQLIYYFVYDIHIAHPQIGSANEHKKW